MPQREFAQLPCCYLHVIPIDQTCVEPFRSLPQEPSTKGDWGSLPRAAATSLDP